MQLLIKWADNWADEMDLSEQFIKSQEDWDKFTARVQSYFTTEDTYTHCVGSNEEIEYDCAEDLIRTYTVQPIPDEDAVILQKYGVVSRYWEGPYPEL